MSNKNRKITTFEKLEEKRNTWAIVRGSLGLLLRLALVGLLGLLLALFLWVYGPAERETISNKAMLETADQARKLVPENFRGNWTLPIFTIGTDRSDWVVVEDLATFPPGRAYINQHWQTFWDRFIRNLILILILLGLALWLVIWRLKVQAGKDSQDTHLRGAKLISPQALNQTIRKHKRQVSLPLGEIKMPLQDETRHALLVGASGTGKTVLLSDLLDKLLERNERIIIHDYKGDFVQRFYNPDRDHLYNPFDERSIGWSIFEALELETDIEAVATTLIPHRNSKEPYFEDASRELLKAIFHHLIAEGTRTYRRLNEVLAMSRPELLRLFEKSPSRRAEAVKIYLQEKGVTASSILSTLRNHTAFFAQMEDRPSFHLDEWLLADRGILFLANHPKTQEALRPMLTVFLDTLAKKLLALPDQHPKRPNKTFFLLDELGRMGKLDAIEDLLTQGRSKGAAVIVSVQDLAQIAEIYGPRVQTTLLNNCATRICFGLSSNQEAETFSAVFGDQEIERRQRSVSYGVKDHRDGISHTMIQTTQRLILPSELLGLPPLEFCLKLPGFDLTKTRVRPKERETLHPPLVQRKGLRLDELYRPENLPPVFIRDQQSQEEEEPEPKKGKSQEAPEPEQDVNSIQY